jgi:predicted nuclease of predicted toxin-antitoxin system
MKFLVDAQLPRRLAQRLNALGHDAVHTLDLPLQNQTPDPVINDLSVQEQRVVITKDADFVNSFIVHHRPYKLLLIATGNISNQVLEQLFLNNLNTLVSGFATYDFIEIDRATITFHS